MGPCIQSSLQDLALKFSLHHHLPKSNLKNMAKLILMHYPLLKLEGPEDEMHSQHMLLVDQIQFLISLSKDLANRQQH